MKFSDKYLLDDVTYSRVKKVYIYTQKSDSSFKMSQILCKACLPMFNHLQYTSSVLNYCMHKHVELDQHTKDELLKCQNKLIDSVWVLHYKRISLIIWCILNGVVHPNYKMTYWFLYPVSSVWTRMERCLTLSIDCLQGQETKMSFCNLCEPSTLTETGENCWVMILWLTLEFSLPTDPIPTLDVLPFCIMLLPQSLHRKCKLHHSQHEMHLLLTLNLLDTHLILTGFLQPFL